MKYNSITVENLQDIVSNLKNLKVVVEDFNDISEVIDIHGVEIDINNKQLILRNYEICENC